jgi:phage gp29-like protein
LKKQYSKMSAEGMKRSLGLIRMKHGSGGSLGSALSPNDAKLQSEIETLMQYINSSCILIETSGWTMESIDTGNFSDAHAKMLKQFDDAIRIAIVGQTLTTDVGDRGSFAAAKQHGDTLIAYQKSDAQEAGTWYNDDLLAKALEVNFGEVDPDDAPKWRSRLLSKPDLNAVRSIYDMGAPIDGTTLASAYDVPLADPESEEPGLILQRKASDPAVGGDGESPDPPKAKQGQQQLAAVDPLEARRAEADAITKTAREDANATVEDELTRYYKSRGEAILRANPRPQ